MAQQLNAQQLEGVVVLDVGGTCGQPQGVRQDIGLGGKRLVV